MNLVWLRTQEKVDVADAQSMKKLKYAMKSEVFARACV